MIKGILSTTWMPGKWETWACMMEIQKVSTILKGLALLDPLRKPYQYTLS